MHQNVYEKSPNLIRKTVNSPPPPTNYLPFVYIAQYDTKPPPHLEKGSDTTTKTENKDKHVINQHHQNQFYSKSSKTLSTQIYTARMRGRMNRYLKITTISLNEKPTTNTFIVQTLKLQEMSEME